MQLYQQVWKNRVSNMKIREEGFNFNKSKNKGNFNFKKFKKKGLN